NGAKRAVAILESQAPWSHPGTDGAHDTDRSRAGRERAQLPAADTAHEEGPQRHEERPGAAHPRDRSRLGARFPGVLEANRQRAAAARGARRRVLFPAPAQIASPGWSPIANPPRSAS